MVADILTEKGMMSAAMSYVNNDYGKGLADSIKANFESRGGKSLFQQRMKMAKVTITQKLPPWRRRVVIF